MVRAFPKTKTSSKTMTTYKINFEAVTGYKTIIIYASSRKAARLEISHLAEFKSWKRK